MIKITLMTGTTEDDPPIRHISKEVMVEVVPRTGEKIHIVGDGGGRIFTVFEVLHSFATVVPEIDVTITDVQQGDVEWLEQHDGWKSVLLGI